MSAETRATFRGVFAFLALTALLAVVAFVFVATADYTRAQAAKPTPLRHLSNEQLLDDLGEPDHIAGCGEFLGEESAGLIGRVFVQQEQQRIHLVCTAP